MLYVRSKCCSGEGGRGGKGTSDLGVIVPVTGVIVPVTITGGRKGRWVFSCLQLSLELTRYIRMLELWGEKKICWGGGRKGKCWGYGKENAGVM